MAQNITLITGSPRIGGNTDLLADAFVRGAVASGNTVTVFHAARRKISGCTDCKYCFRHGGECRIQDDMKEIYTALREPGLLLLASPVYWYGLTGQIKTALDRLFAGARNPFPITGIGLLLTAGSQDPEVMAPSIAHFESISRCMGWKNIGTVTAPGVRAPGDIKEHPSLQAAYEFGKSIL
jgi:multimeric flavodoxin WrbA